MKSLVTGASGLIGSNLSSVLLARGDSVVGLDDFSAGERENVARFRAAPEWSFHEGDVRDGPLIKNLMTDADLTFHLAAKKIPRYGNAVSTLEVNGLASWSILSQASAAAKPVVLASTSDVYGMSDDLPFHEESRLVMGQPSVRRWAYAISKMFGEQALAAFVDEGVPWGVAVRFFGTYGPGQLLGWQAGPVPVFIGAALDGDALQLHGDGEQMRTFCFVEDTARGLSLVPRFADRRFAVVNIGAEDEVSIAELAEMIWSLVRPQEPLRVDRIPYSSFGRYEDVRRRRPSVELMRDVTGWEPTVPLQVGLRRTIIWQAQRRIDLGRASGVEQDVIARLQQHG